MRKDRVQQIFDIPKGWFERDLDIILKSVNWLLKSIAHFFWKKHDIWDVMIAALFICPFIVSILRDY